MPNLNRVFLMGNLTRDPELRYIPSGSAVVSFSIAVNRFYTRADGEKKEEVSFIRIVVWGKRAEVCNQYLHKGSPVFVEGRLQSRSWETQDGQKRNMVEVVAQRVEFLGRARPEVEPGPSGEEVGSGESGPDQIFDEDTGTSTAPDGTANNAAFGGIEPAETNKIEEDGTSKDKVPF